MKKLFIAVFALAASLGSQTAGAAAMNAAGHGNGAQPTYVVPVNHGLHKHKGWSHSHHYAKGHRYHRHHSYYRYHRHHRHHLTH